MRKSENKYCSRPTFFGLRFGGVSENSRGQSRRRTMTSEQDKVKLRKVNFGTVVGNGEENTEKHDERMDDTCKCNRLLLLTVLLLLACH